MGLVDAVFDDVKDVKVDDDHGEDCDALFVGEVAEDALDCAFHFRIGEDGDEGVGCG